MINLISDTVTKPTPGMLDYMMHVEVGDDVFGNDPTVNKLQKMVAEMFGKEDALFCPSGTMTNQIAIMCHTRPLDEMICDHSNHVYRYETGGYAFNAGIAISLIKGQNGKITASQVEAAIQPKYDWLPNTKLVVIENTTNKGGGDYYTSKEIKAIGRVCRDHDLKYHMDGARIFNAIAETGQSTKEIGNLVDSISICISKGLGAPVGSVLTGDYDFIAQARRYRKVLGGGMRQAGYLAGACIYALTHHVDRLKLDHQKAKELGDLLQTKSYVKDIKPVKTNIIILELEGGITSESFVSKLREHRIVCSAFGPSMVRLVTHMDYSDAQHRKALNILDKVNF